MKIYLFALLFSLVALTACKKYDIENDVPKCIKKEIKKMPTCDNTANAKEYWFQNKTVYALYTGYCNDITSDQNTVVYDTDCNELGVVSNATPDINGENFFDNAIYVRTVWTK